MKSDETKTMLFGSFSAKLQDDFTTLTASGWEDVA